MAGEYKGSYMIYFVQIGLFVLFLCAAWLLKLFNQGKLAYRQYRKNKQNDQDYLEAEKTIQLLLDEFGSRPVKFEAYVAEVFKAAGYEDVTVTKASNDGGKDLIMYKNGKKYVAEVKLYQPAYKISRERIQKLHSAMLDSDADGAFFVTTSDFTQNAVLYAGKHEISLLNGYLFGRFVHLLEEEDKKGKSQLMLLHEMLEEDRLGIKDKNRKKAWLMMGLFLLLYPVYTVGYLFFLNRVLQPDEASYAGMLTVLIILNAVNLRIIAKCLIRIKGNEAK